MNVYSFLTKNADLTKIAIKSKAEEKTYADIVHMVEAICTLLAQLETQPGERVAILAYNSSFWVASYLGILRYGAVAVPVPTDQHESTITHFMQMTDCNICCIDGDHQKKFTQLPVEHIVTPENMSQCPIDTEREIPTYFPEDTDLAALMFTSGSTGMPNAVKISHKNIVTNTKAIVQYLKLTNNDRIMAILPFYYCFGTSLLHSYLQVGGSLVINNHFLYTEKVLDDMESYECTGFAGVPSVYQRLVKRSTFTKREFKYLRLLQQAGGRLSPHTIKEIVEIFPEKEFYVMYGQTEATARLTYLPPELVLDKINSIGKAIPYVNIEILNDQDAPIQHGEEGEIVCSGDSIALGYWQDDPNNRFIDNKLHTGDIATIDSEGYLYIVGRKSDFLKPGGNRISSHKIVDALLLHPGVVEAEVVGVYDSNLGEVIRAFIGIGSNDLSEQEIKRHCLNHLPRYAIPAEIILTEEIPKNKAGKTQKKLLLNYKPE